MTHEVAIRLTDEQYAAIKQYTTEHKLQLAEWIARTATAVAVVQTELQKCEYNRTRTIARYHRDSEEGSPG